MANFSIDVNESIKLTAKLESLHRSAFPSAVRNTLNNAAFDVKREVGGVARGMFTTRNKSFIKSMTGFNKATGFNVNSMKSVVGITGNNKINSKRPNLAKNLAAHENGGTVKDKKLIGHEDSRIGKSRSKNVRRSNYRNKINYHNANNAFKGHKGSRNSKFVAAVYSTIKSGKDSMMLSSNGKGTVWKINKFSSNRSSKSLNFKMTKLYRFRETPKYTAKRKGFMRKTSNIAASKIPKFYAKNAEFQFNKHLKK